MVDPEAFHQGRRSALSIEPANAVGFPPPLPESRPEGGQLGESPEGTRFRQARRESERGYPPLGILFYDAGRKVPHDP